jgi:hypothetical protein
LTPKNLWDQFWADVYGKEVQTTATYSYTWVADQFGHICLGLIGNFAATALCGVVMTLLGWSSEFHYDTGKWPGLVIVSVGAAVWEWFAYSKSADEATKLFPLDKALLLANAQVVAAYMILGGVLGFAFHFISCGHSLSVRVCSSSRSCSRLGGYDRKSSGRRRRFPTCSASRMCCRRSTSRTRKLCTTSSSVAHRPT